MAKKPKRKVRKKSRAAGASLRRDTISRAALAREIQHQVKRFGLSRAKAGKVLDEAASQMSRLMTGYVGDFSVDRLAKILVDLGSDVTVQLRHAAKLGRRGKVRIKVG